MKRPRLGWAILVGAWAAGCGASPAAQDGTASTSSAIESGSDDTTHTFAVGIVQLLGQNAAFCSGALLAPNLVATARHCVADLANSPGMGQVDCPTTTFSPPVSVSNLYVTTDAVITANSAFVRVSKVVVPSGTGTDKVCGNDVALLILTKNIDVPQYVVPVLQPPMTDHGSYSTQVTAIGYGVSSPTDTMGTSAGTRRIKQDVGLACIPNDKKFTDCFSDPTASGFITANEFMSGDKSTCEGDSGSNAYEQNNFNAGKWVSFGVLSRGGVQGADCVQPIYTRFDAWSQLLIQAANEAAQAGGYAPPSWTSSGGASDGTSCAADGECQSQNCVSTDNKTFVCASACGANSACASGFACRSGFCFPSPSTPPTKSGCAMAPAEAGTMPGRAVALGALALAAAALRRRTTGQRNRAR
jgi:hypothetical protein